MRAMPARAQEESHFELTIKAAHFEGLPGWPHIALFMLS